MRKYDIVRGEDLAKLRDKVPVTSGMIGDAGKLKALRFSVELRGSVILRNEYRHGRAKRVDVRDVGFLIPEDFKGSLAVQSASGGTVFEIACIGNGFFP